MSKSKKVKNTKKDPVQTVVRAGDDGRVYVEKKHAHTHAHSHAHKPHTCRTPQLTKKVKNLLSLLIFIGGGLVGSLFVDVAQFFTDRGLSARALGEAQVVSYDDATWVRYEEEKIPVDVFVSASLSDEDRAGVDAALSALAVFMPTIEARVYDVGTDTGLARATDAGIAFVPALRFDGVLSDHPYYQDASDIFVPRSDDTYILRPGALELPVVERFDTPRTDRGLIVGRVDAPHSVTVFEDVLCEGCGARHIALTTLQSKHPQSFTIIYKHVSTSSDEASRAGTIAAHCAYEQGVYERYMQILSTNTAWKIVAPDVRRDLFGQYASYINELDALEFSACYNESRYENQLVADTAEADYLGVQSKTQIFIDGMAYEGDAQNSGALIATLEERFEL